MNALEKLLRELDREGSPQKVVIEITEDGMVRAFLTEKVKYIVDQPGQVSLDSNGDMHMIAEADNINEALIQLNQIEDEAQQRAVDTRGTS